MVKGGLRWKRCPGQAGSTLAAELLPLQAAAGGLGSWSRAPELPTAPPGLPTQRGRVRRPLPGSASPWEHPSPAKFCIPAGASPPAPAPAAHPGRFVKLEPEPPMVLPPCPPPSQDPPHPQHCPLGPSHLDKGCLGLDFGQGVPLGLGARSHPWPWPRAHGWVGNHSSYSWFSPWEVLLDGGREHPDLVPEVPEVPSPGWVKHTRAQGTAVLGTGRDVLHLSPSPSLLAAVGTLPVPVPVPIPVPVPLLLGGP